MKIFSEIYGKYFRIATEVLSKRKISESQIYNIIEKEGFRDSLLFLPQKIIPQKDGKDWGLLKKDEDGRLSPVLKNSPVEILTKIQKMWLKSKLADPKTKLFLDEEGMEKLAEKLEEVEPLYRKEDFRFTDIFADGDDFDDSRYKRHFRIILAAIKDREVLTVGFTSGHGERICAKYLPIKFEYSQKNDKLRVLCYSVKKGRTRGEATLNIGRIEEIEKTGIFINDIDRKRRSGRESVTVKVSTGRNAVERFMTEFAGYEKETERDIETGKCVVKLFYDKQDETELLIGLLSFGPVIEIMEPEGFRAQAAERVRREFELIK